MQNTPCSAPSTAVTQGRHGGRNGRLTAITHVFHNTFVTVQLRRRNACPPSARPDDATMGLSVLLARTRAGRDFDELNVWWALHGGQPLRDRLEACVV